MNFKIKEEKNVFDDHFLDVIGNEFKFDHVKGLAEWIKNSADAYTRDNFSDDDQHILLRFSRKDAKQIIRIECIDFVGMTKDDINKAFKRWGDPRAASRGSKKKTLGGHGNGGKFYMRQMFKMSRFLTYRNGKLNVFGFNEHRRYGFAEGYDDKPMSAPDALAFAGIKGLNVPKRIRDVWAKSKEGVGFTLVIGEQPDKSKLKLSGILEGLCVHSQSRRLVKRKQIFAYIDSDANGTQLKPQDISPYPGFEGPFQIELPKTVEWEEKNYAFWNSKYPKAYLVLNTSAEPFGRMGERSSLNCIDVLGEVGCIGSYRLNELGWFKNSAQAEFVYGECFCPILESPEEDLVKNDREKLVESEKTAALLKWIQQQVDALCEKIAEKEKKEKKATDLKQSSVLNEFLNRWKNKFLTKLLSEILGGPNEGDSFGGSTGGGSEKVGSNKGAGGGGKKGGGENGDSGGGSGVEPKKARRFPRVLLSGYDADPLNPTSQEALNLNPRHPAIYQRTEDVDEGIYWINTSRPLASRITNQYTRKSPRWREYLFQRYVDIIVKEALYQKARKEPNLTAEIVDQLMNDVVSKIHDAAVEDLDNFLFEEAFGTASGNGEGQIN